MLYRAGVKSPEEVLAAGEDRYVGTPSIYIRLHNFIACKHAF
jgi:hypothetical protein